MPASTQSNPAYRKRRITAMLEEPTFREMSHEVESSPRTWSPKFISAVVGLACVSAVSVFLVLYHHDKSAASAPGPAAVSAAPAEGQGRAGSAAAAQNVAAQETAGGREAAANRGVAVPEPVAFKIKRSSKYQSVGPVGLRLLRVNLRRRVCDVSIELEDHHKLQRHLQLNKPLQLKPASSGDAIEIVVSNLSRDSVAGSLSTVSSPINAQN